VLLEGHGYEVEQAANGSEALEKAQAHEQDLIISDILMPVMDGFSLCRALKADNRLKHIPLIFYTATYTDSRDEKLALDMGVNAFIIKPMEPDEFMRRIEAILAANKDGKLNASQKQTEGDEIVLKEYNEVLINKLEQKMLSLEKANKALETEIAARKQAEESLLKSEKRLRRLYESGLLGMFYWNRDGQITDANDKFLDMIGYSREDMAAGRINGYRMTPPEFKIVDERSVSELHTADVNKIPFEKEYIRKDGTRLSILIAGALLDRERFNGIAFVLDITERKIAESQREAALEALREKELQYRNLADSGLALIWTSGTDKLCNYFNASWLKFTGHTLEQEMGNGWTQGVHPDDFDNCLKTYVTAFDKRQAFDMEYRLRNAHGEYRWIRDLGTPNYSSNGEFIGYIGHCFDITMQREAETEIRKLNQYLEQQIDERTAKLKETIVQLEEMNRVFVGRELKMVELKERIAELENQKT
jgi:PAS domain S-box-containing protein